MLDPLAPWADEHTPALAIVARGDQIETVAANQFVVRSQSRPDSTYQVLGRRDRWSCTCAYFGASTRWCIHIRAVRILEGARSKRGPASQEQECAYCRSTDTMRYGKRRTLTGVVTRFLCRTCARRFTAREGFRNRRADPERIALALDLYFRGLSLRKVAEHLEQVHDMRVSPSTIYAWVARGSILAARWMDSLQPRTGERWHVDETVISTDGRSRYLWNVVDSQSRFLLATHVSRLRRVADTRVPLRKAKAATPDRPMEVLTDGMRSYPRAVGKELAYRSGKEVVNPHQRVRSIRAKKSNNLVERLHGTEKDRIKVMRGFDTRRGAKALMEGFRVHYNMVRDHGALGTTPGVAAGLPDVGGFRWKGILELARKPRPTEFAEIEFIVSSRRAHSPTGRHDSHAEDRARKFGVARYANLRDS